MKKLCFIGLALAVGMSSTAWAGPYSAGLDDWENAFDAPVPGFTGPAGAGKARLADGTGNFQNPENRVNPLFYGWAESFSNYHRSDSDKSFDDGSYALGPVSGDNFDVVALGDMSAAAIAAGDALGTITLHFSQPIRNLSGADFVIFENSLISQFDTGGSGVGGVFAELAYVEVSADGVVFERFPSDSQTPAAVGSYGSIDPTDVFNLAGKHVNSYGDSWGTPFDLSAVGLDSISYIRLVDIPGNGAFKDSEGKPIYDSWRTFGSGGFDLEAVGAISIPTTFEQWPRLEDLPSGERGALADPDRDGIPNLLEYAHGLDPSRADSAEAGFQTEIVRIGGENYPLVTCLRDERAVDLIREIEVSEDLVSWSPLARSSSGGPLMPVENFVVVESERSTRNPASVGVIHTDRVIDFRSVPDFPNRFYRLSVHRE